MIEAGGPSSAAGDYVVVPVALEEARDAVVSLWSRNMVDVPPSRFRWLYQENAAGKAHCCLVRERSGRVVGAAALFPKRFVLGRRPVMAGIAGDLIVDRRHRGLGPALLLQRALLASACAARWEFVYGFPSPTALAVQRRAGFQVIGFAARFVRPLSPAGLVRHVRAAANAVRRRPIASVRSMLHFVRRRTPSAMRRDVVVERTSGNLDDLEECAARCHRPGVVTPERTARFLEWRFEQCPNPGFSIDAIRCTVTRRLLGYVASQVHNDTRFIWDMQVPGDTDAPASAIQALLDVSRAEALKTVSVRCLPTRDMIDGLDRCGFINREVSPVAVAFTAATPGVADALSRGQWSLFEADNDV